MKLGASEKKMSPRSFLMCERGGREHARPKNPSASTTSSGRLIPSQGTDHPLSGINVFITSPSFMQNRTHSVHSCHHAKICSAPRKRGCAFSSWRAPYCPQARLGLLNCVLKIMFVAYSKKMSLPGEPGV
jgi:hypothetical protein